MKLEVGKYYKDANGEKRGPMRESTKGRFDFYRSAYYFDDRGRSIDGDDPDLISEWIETPPETGTLRDLNVKPGDVVEWSLDNDDKTHTIVRVEGSTVYLFENEDAHKYVFDWPIESSYGTWRMVSSAKQSPVITETVTTQRIVPGVYGNVRVYDETCESGNICLKVGSDGYHWTVAELTAAIETLTAIRDALAHNSAK